MTIRFIRTLTQGHKIAENNIHVCMKTPYLDNTEIK